MISIPAVCWGILAGSVFEAIVNTLICRKEIGVGIKTHIKTQLDVIVSTLIICVIVYFTISLINGALLKLLLGGFMGITLYLSATWVFNIKEKEYIKYALSFINKL